MLIHFLFIITAFIVDNTQAVHKSPVVVGRCDSWGTDPNLIEWRHSVPINIQRLIVREEYMPENAFDLAHQVSISNLYFIKQEEMSQLFAMSPDSLTRETRVQLDPDAVSTTGVPANGLSGRFLTFSLRFYLHPNLEENTQYLLGVQIDINGGTAPSLVYFADPFVFAVDHTNTVCRVLSRDFGSNSFLASAMDVAPPPPPVSSSIPIRGSPEVVEAQVVEARRKVLEIHNEELDDDTCPHNDHQCTPSPPQRIPFLRDSPPQPHVPHPERILEETDEEDGAERIDVSVNGRQRLPRRPRYTKLTVEELTASSRRRLECLPVTQLSRSERAQICAVCDKSLEDGDGRSKFAIVRAYCDVISDRMEPRLSLLGDHFFHRECLRSCYRSQGADLACPRCQARLHTEFFDSVVDGDSPPLLTQSFPLSK